MSYRACLYRLNWNMAKNVNSGRLVILYRRFKRARSISIELTSIKRGFVIKIGLAKNFNFPRLITLVR